MTSTLTGTELEVLPLSSSIGAVVRGVDLKEADDEAIAAIRKVWLERKVVFFPGQHLDETEHQAFGARFGELTEGHPVVPSVEGFPNLFEIDYSKARELYAHYGDLASRQQGTGWHTDVTFMPRPPAGSILRAVVIPPSGGDTVFSNQQAAFEALSPAFRDFLSTLHAVHDGKAQFSTVLERVGQGKWEGLELPDLEPVTHPVVRTHPETGAQVLFVNPGFTSHILELTPAELSGNRFQFGEFEGVPFLVEQYRLSPDRLIVIVRISTIRRYEIEVVRFVEIDA